MQIVLESLGSAGLDQREAALYLSLLALQRATVLEISRHSGVERGATYRSLELLEQKSVIRSEVAANGTLIYSPISPADLHQLAEKRLVALENTLPILHRLSGVKTGPPITHYQEGPDVIADLLIDAMQECIGTTDPHARALYCYCNPATSEYLSTTILPQVQSLAVAHQIPLFVSNTSAGSSIICWGTITAQCDVDPHHWVMTTEHPGIALAQRQLLQKMFM
jgi:hypothetical protein